MDEIISDSISDLAKYLDVASMVVRLPPSRCCCSEHRYLRRDFVFGGERTHEIADSHRARCAQRKNVLTLVLGEGIKLVLLGAEQSESRRRSDCRA